MKHYLSRRKPASGFTLVELLVVIGIIALLIAILLPSLAQARRTAQRTACAAKLQQMMVAATLHANDHHGYYPLVGVVPSDTPPTLDDAYSQKYAYQSRKATLLELKFGGFVDRELASITDSLSVYLGFKDAILQPSNAVAVSQMSDAKGAIRNFLCPSQANEFADIAARVPDGSGLLFYSVADGNYYNEPQSYVFNEALLGWYDPMNRLRGKANKVRQPSLTMFAADGLHGTPGVEIKTPYAAYTLYNNTTKGTVTMGDAFSGRTALAGEAACFDKKRHQLKINVAFCDGHVESRNMNDGDLSRIYLVSP